MSATLLGTTLAERLRLKALLEIEEVGSPIEPQYQAVCRAAQALFDVPVALVTLVAEDRQWFKGNCGLDVDGTSREVSFCTHAIMSTDVMVVEDATRDARFQNNPLVTGSPFVVFYAGAPLILDHGVHLGSLCLIDHVPRILTCEQKNQLQHLAAVVTSGLRQNRSRMRTESWLRRIVDGSPDVITHAAVSDGKYTYTSEAMGRLFGYAPGELIGRNGLDLVHADDRQEMADVFSEFRAGSGRLVVLKQRWLCKNGGYLQVATSFRPSNHDDGHGQGVVSVIRERHSATAPC